MRRGGRVAARAIPHNRAISITSGEDSTRGAIPHSLTIFSLSPKMEVAVAVAMATDIKVQTAVKERGEKRERPQRP